MSDVILLVKHIHNISKVTACQEEIVKLVTILYEYFLCTTKAGAPACLMVAPAPVFSFT